MTEERKEKITKIEYEIIAKYVSLRKEAKMTQDELAKFTSVIRTTIARIERNMHSPKLSTMLELLEPLGYKLTIVPIDEKENK